uniref:BUD13 homolog n=1 Tax=Myxine glutinosa TaxID=7769 RepID=UPI00358EF85B
MDRSSFAAKHHPGMDLWVNVAPMPYRLRILDDDVDWRSYAVDSKEDPVASSEEDEVPAVAEFVDERPREVQILEEYRQTRKWRLIDADASTSPSMSSIKSSPQHRKGNQTENPNVRASSPHHGDLKGGTTSQVSCAGSDSPSPARDLGDKDLPDQNTHPNEHSRHDSDSDLSPPQRKTSRQDREGGGSSPSDNKKTKARHDSDSDVSPLCQDDSFKKVQRHKKRNVHSKSDGDQSRCRKLSTHSSDSDLSPPRQEAGAAGRCDRDDFSQIKQQRFGGVENRDSDSDLSPPRRDSCVRDASPRAGLVSAIALQHERNKKGHENSQQQQLEEESRTEKTVFREHGGRKRFLEQEHKAKQAKDREEEQKAARYAAWGHGLVQVAQKLENQDLQPAQPLARYRDDAELDQILREKQRDGDPMAGLLTKKTTTSTRPVYNGAAPPNRFDIKPGYRWDGVDRSNGFEKKRYQRLAERSALAKETYQWSTQDM